MVGLLDYFMPGETGGMPNAQPKSKFSGLLEDPLFQFGLGVLGNSQGTSFGTALGRGGLQASQNVNYQRQIAQQKQMQDMQMKDTQRRLDQADAMQKAKEAFKLAHPEYADAVDLDPTLAIKAAYPNIAKNGADPYYTTIPTNAGLGKFNARDGSFELITNADGTPYIKSSDDPVTRGKVKAAEQYGGGLFKPNTDVDGLVSTDSQVSLMANPALGGIDFISQIPQNTSVPKPDSSLQMINPKPSAPTPKSFPRVTPKEQSARDDMRLQILLDEQKKLGGAGVDPQLDAEINGVSGGRIPSRPSFGGISVPTKAQQAGASEKAKSIVQLAMDPQIASAVTDAKNKSNLKYEPEINSANKKAMLETEASTQAQLDLPKVQAQAQETIKLVDELISHPGLSKSVGMMSYNPSNKIAGTDARDFKNRLDQIKGKQFLQAFESLKGGGSITEVEGQNATNAIARMNTSSSEDEFKKAAQEFKDVIKAGLIRAQERSKTNPQQSQQSSINQNQSNVFDAMPKPNQYKGKIIRDNVTGKRYQSNGLQWKEVK